MQLVRHPVTLRADMEHGQAGHRMTARSVEKVLPADRNDKLRTQHSFVKPCDVPLRAEAQHGLKKDCERTNVTAMLPSSKWFA